MTLAGLTLGNLALAKQREMRRTRVGPDEVASGLASMAALIFLIAPTESPKK